MEGSVFKRRLRVSLPCALGFPAMSLYFPFGFLCGFPVVSVWLPMVSHRFLHDFPAVSLWFPSRLFSVFLAVSLGLPCGPCGSNQFPHGPQMVSLRLPLVFSCFPAASIELHCGFHVGPCGFHSRFDSIFNDVSFQC